MISCNALVGISTRTLNIKGYIKKEKVIVLIDYGNTHNFIHYKLAKSLYRFIYPAIYITMGEYVMNNPMISIPMGGVDVVLGVQLLQSLETMAFNFQELFMKFSLEGK